MIHLAYTDDGYGEWLALDGAHISVRIEYTWPEKLNEIVEACDLRVPSPFPRWYAT